MRVFLDTNVLVAAFATRGLCADVLQVVLAEQELVLGEAVLFELPRVLRAKLRLPANTAQEVEAFLRSEAEVIQDARALGIALRDPDEIAVLEQAVAGQVDVLVTGNRDLLAVHAEAPIGILDPRGFWERLRSE